MFDKNYKIKILRERVKNVEKIETIFRTIEEWV